MTVPALTRRHILANGMQAGAGVLALMLGGCGGAGTSAVGGAVSEPPVPVPVPVPPAPPVATRSEWRPLRIGAGGWVTGIDIAPDGTKVVRCDTYGAYIWSDTASEWKPLLTSTSMPAGDWGHQTIEDQGVFEVAVAPSNSNRIYVVYNGYVFRSSDKGTTFVKTKMSRITASPNDDFRTFGRKMAVDPINPDVVYLGTQAEGLLVSTDGGGQWSAVASVTKATSGAGIMIAFDPSSGSTGQRTKTIYVSSEGHGVFVSRDGGASFAVTPGTPKSHRHMICDQSGSVYFTDRSVSSDNVLRFNGSSWNKLAVGSQTWHSIAVDPANAAHVVAGSDGGTLNQSFDGGATWTGPYYPGYPAGAGVRKAADIPWLAWTKEDYLSNGDMRFDPSTPGKLFFAEGIGVWTTTTPGSFIGFDWQSQSRGIEQLVTNTFVSPPSGGALYYSWDRPVFKITNPDIFPATHGPNRDNSICMGWSGDYAVDDGNFVVGLMNWFGVEQSGYSRDGGQTWNKFGAMPAEIVGGKIGGSIAVSTAKQIVVVANNNGNPYYSSDGGATWQLVRISGIPTTGETGWGWAYFLNRHIVAADKVNEGTFYLYNYLPAAIGLYRSTNGGADWTRIYSKEIASASGFNARLAAVPGKAGHLFFTSGFQTGTSPSPTDFTRSTDGGASWSSVANVKEVYAFGFGKAAPGQSYPTVFIAGYVNGTWGLWRSTDNCATWVSIGDYPLGNFDRITAVTGDMAVYGRAYVGFLGSGGAYAELVV